MKKCILCLLTGLILLSFITIKEANASNPLNGYDVQYASEELTVIGTVTQSIQTPEPAPKPTRNLVEVRKKRENHKYQQAPVNIKGKRQIKVKAHAYCLRGLTSRGVPTRTGVVAVDPNVIPYGSKIYVPGYGWGTALDTGGAIKGNTIDIWMPTYSQCMQWGTKYITVTVVTP